MKFNIYIYLNLNDTQINNLPMSFQNKNLISLINSPIQINIHEHPLIYCCTKNRAGAGWTCNKCSISYSYESYTFYCTFCDFDLCENCLGQFQLNQILLYDYNYSNLKNIIKISKDNYEWQKKFSVHHHMLTLLNKQNDLNSWVCNKCFQTFKNNISCFYCSLCDFNLCQNCGNNIQQDNNNLQLSNNQIQITIPQKLKQMNFPANQKDSFQIKSFTILSQDFFQKNLIYSPFPIRILFSLLANGTSGKSLLEIQNVFSFNSLELENNTNIDILKIISNYSSFEITNILYLIYNPSFQFSIYSSNYQTKIAKTINEINLFIQQKTNNLISNFVPSTLLSEFLLINVLYFKGEWKKKFELIYKEFTSSNGVSKIVQMMNCKDNYRYFKNDIFEAIEIPYNKDDITALILLPNRNNSINNLINNLNQKDLNELYNNRLENKIVNLIIPKFSFNKQDKINLKSMLIKIGLSSLFNVNEANFSNMFEIINKNNFFINEAFQTNLLNVNENGTEITSVTIVSVFSSPLEMIVDRPFLFIIRNTKFEIGKDILLIAKIEDL